MPNRIRFRNYPIFNHAYVQYLFANSSFASQFSSTIFLLTVCPRSSAPFYIVTYYIKWVTTSWTDGIISYGDKYCLKDRILITPKYPVPDTGVKLPSLVVSHAHAWRNLNVYQNNSLYVDFGSFTVLGPFKKFFHIL